MTQPPDPSAIALTILTSPVWARHGLAVLDERMRERAADVLAARVIALLAGEPDGDDPDQLCLIL